MAYAEKRGKGAKPWRVRYQSPDGSWASEPGFATKQDALDYGRAQETDVRRQVFIDPRDGEITLGTFVESWLPAIDVAPKSEYEYRKRLDGHILPRWGEVQLRKITGLAFRAWEKELRKTYSKNYVDGIISVLRMLLDDAVEEKLIPRSPIPPRKRRRGRYVRKDKDEKVWASPEQALSLAENARIRWAPNGEMGYAIVLTLAYTGMRMGEIAGIKREDCQFLGKEYGRRINLTRQFQYIEGAREFPDPKYGSARSILLPPFLADLLSRLLSTHTAPTLFTALKGGQLLAGGDFYTFFWRPLVDGRCAAPPTRGRGALPEIPPVEGLAGSGMIPHGLRHGHKVWLDEDLMPRVAVEERLGHILQGIESVYGHVTEAMEVSIAQALQARWERSCTASAGDETASGVG
ncbi:hypothetical protein [Embleya sp. NPDC005971]|uniref:tyrosine-type recombinase/integrase n=1 Tax=Embleya sp. NPDC005971 TaxID=3156724 RepID=UPI0034074A1A